MGGIGALIGTSRWRRPLRRLRDRLDPRAVVLMYHRVADLPSDPFELAVTPKHFSEHMDVLHRHYRPTPLRELVPRLHGRGPARRIPGFREAASALTGRGIPRRTVAVTFDDGYQDNHALAMGILDQHDVPATIFVATGYTDTDREFWWDELERHVLHPHGTAASAKATNFCEQETWARFLSLHQRLRPLSANEQRRTLDELAEKSGRREARRTHLPMSSMEVRALHDAGLVEIGAHTVSHPSLAAQPLSVQREEISQSKSKLEEIIGEPVLHFAYPYGTKEDYTNATANIVRDLGFVSACTTTRGLVTRGDDPFQLRRIVIRNWDGDQFARTLHELLDD
jgi:peptidoglycan/xylan/chitin deacetylase (PgdA/CDA1 family)